VILHVVRYWPTLSETFVRDEIADLARDLDEPVEVLGLGARGDPHAPDDDPAGVRVHRRPHGAAWTVATAAVLHGAARYAGAAWRGALRGGAPPRPRPDRIDLWMASHVARARHVHVHFAGEAAARVRRVAGVLGVPWSVSVHAVDLYRPRPDLPEMLRDAVAVRTISHANARLLATACGVRATVIRCGVTLLPEEPAPDDAYGHDVLFVGRAVPKKGLAVLREAATRLPTHVRIGILGDATGPAPPQGARWEVLGPRPHAETLARIAAARVVCVPCTVASDGDRDGVPVVLLEALARGVPVVTTDLDGLDELVDESVGWVVPRDAPDALADALRTALADPREARVRGARGPARLRERGFDRDSRRAALARWFSVDAAPRPR
jgi:glycosyltransferase involved in cell wall biosynthesis